MTHRSGGCMVGEYRHEVPGNEDITVEKKYDAGRCKFPLPDKTDFKAEREQVLVYDKS